MRNEPSSPYDPPQSKIDEPETRPAGPMKIVTGFFVAVVGSLAGLYLLNPTAGFFELIPDNIPIVGNLDEAAAIGLLLSCLAYFGIDLNRIFGIFGFSRKPSEDAKAKGQNAGAKPPMREAHGRVVD